MPSKNAKRKQSGGGSKGSKKKSHREPKPRTQNKNKQANERTKPRNKSSKKKKTKSATPLVANNTDRAVAIIPKSKNPPKVSIFTKRNVDNTTKVRTSMNNAKHDKQPRKRSVRPAFAVSKLKDPPDPSNALRKVTTTVTIFKKPELVQPPPPTKPPRSPDPSRKSKRKPKKEELKRPVAVLDDLPKPTAASPAALLEPSDEESKETIDDTVKNLPAVPVLPKQYKRKSIRPDIEKYAQYTMLSTDNVVKVKTKAEAKTMPQKPKEMFIRKPARGKKVVLDAPVSPNDSTETLESGGSATIHACAIPFLPTPCPPPSPPPVKPQEKEELESEEVAESNETPLSEIDTAQAAEQKESKEAETSEKTEKSASPPEETQPMPVVKSNKKEQPSTRQNNQAKKKKTNTLEPVADSNDED